MIRKQLTKNLREFFFGKDGDIMIRTLSEFEGVDDILNIVVKSNTSGRRVRIKNIAKVIHFNNTSMRNNTQVRVYTY